MTIPTPPLQSRSQSTCDWILPNPADPERCRALAKALGVPPFLAALLCRRGLVEAEAAALFLDPKLKSLRDPFLLPGMEAAVERLLRAIDQRERIVLYGDYDVDGVTSLALFRRVLQAFGAAVECFLPMRMDEGYGLSAEGIARCVSTLRPNLLLAIDCGTSSAAEIASLQAEGVEVIVFDHHSPKCELPACTLVNPKLGSEGNYLCSVGIMFKAAHALLKRRPLPELDLREYLDYVALGTVADLVPLAAENRIFVKRGLAQIAQSRWPGVRALLEVSAAKPPLTPVDIGFKLGPRMNAAGRLGTAADALELLLTEDPRRAAALAASLDAQNRERRAVEDGVLTEAEALLAQEFVPERDPIIVTGAAGWHSGVVGIVASRLMKRHHRPTLVVAFDEQGLGKGSGRSVTGFSLVQALAACGEWLEKHGGHDMAAGFTVEHSRFEGFRQALLEYGRKTISAELLRRRIVLDGELQLREVSLPLLQLHDQLQPFGISNLQPVFFARGVTLSMEPKVMKEKHLSLRLRQGRDEARAVWFGAAQEELPPPPWDVAFTIERNEYQGYVNAQMEIRAVRAAG